MKTYDAIVIGSGQGGARWPTISRTWASRWL